MFNQLAPFILEKQAVLNIAQMENMEVLNVLNIKKTVTNMDDIFADAEYKAIFEGHKNEHEGFIRRRYTEDNYKVHFTDVGVYQEWFTSDGLHVLGKVEPHSMIHDGNFNQAFVKDNDYVIVVKRNWKKCKKNRMIFAKNQGIVLID